MTKDLFIKYLQGNCTEKEFEKILSWIREGSTTTSGKVLMHEIWDEFEPGAGSEEKNKYNLILDKIHHNINISHNANHLAISKTPFGKRILSVITRAAAILLLPVLSLLLYTNLPEKGHLTEQLSDMEVEAPLGGRINFKLSDGTKVWLNHGSKLKYPFRFEGENRKVFLTGEAFFDVVHNKAVPFIVGTNHIEVKATGTAFNVSAYSNDSFVETTLVEGKVIINKYNTNKVIRELSPKECLKFDFQSNKYLIASENTEKNIAWKDGQLVFKNDLIEDIAQKLARWYNIEVEIIDSKIKKFTCTATFTDETLTQVLDLMTLATPVSYKLTSIKKLPDGSFSKQKVLIGLKNTTKKIITNHQKN